jgi:hypothetical protein
VTNPTSNYNFQMPTATDLVTDLPADFEVFGQAVDTRLKALQPGTTLGDLAYSSATANTNTRLPIGTSGQVLTVSGGGVPAWTTSGASGKVLQVKNFTIFNSLTSATNTWVTTNLTLSITPSLATSKVLVIVQHCGCGKSNTDAYLEVKLRRDTTDILVFEDRGGFTQSTAFNIIGTVGTTYLDSPATTSAISYNTQFRSGGNTSEVRVGYWAGAHSTITLMEIGA